MKTTKPKNKQNRGYIFGIVLHPKFPDNYKSPSWNELKNNEIVEELELLKFPVKFDISELFNLMLFPTLKGNQNEILDWRFQLEFGDENGIPHYQAYTELKFLSHISDVRKVINDSFDTCLLYTSDAADD